MHTELHIMQQAARAGGEQLTSWFGQLLTLEQKSSAADVRTQADTASEAAILEILQTNYPAYSIIAEESGVQQQSSDYTFVIDPLDGTNNFVLGIPYFTVSIGLLHHDQAVAGVVYNPISDQLYSGSTGNGSWLNNRLVRVSAASELDQMTLSYTQGYTVPRARFDRLNALLHQRGLKRLLSMWSPAHDLALIAAGTIDGMIGYGTEIYDHAAGLALVQAAGGVVTDWTGMPLTVTPKDGQWIAAGTPATAALLCELWGEAR